MQQRHISWVLSFIGMLMLGHLGIIYIDLWACYDYYKFLLNTTGDLSSMGSTTCQHIEATYQEAVDKYLAIALALITGGAAGATIAKRADHE